MNRRLRRELGVLTAKRRTGKMDFADVVQLLLENRRKAREDQVKELLNDDVLKFQQRWCCGFHNLNPMRANMTRFVRSVPFRMAILCLIIVNTICLAAYDPIDTQSKGQRNQILDGLDFAFNIAFTLELLLKLIAIGWSSGDPPAWYQDMLEARPGAGRPITVHGGVRTAMAKKLGLGKIRVPSTCGVRSGLILGGWNMLDIVVVVFAWFVFALEQAFTSDGIPTSLTSLRALRALKILRAGKHMPRMKAMVDDVLAAIPLMANVMALLGFIFFIFGLAGTRFFGGGAFRNRCWNAVTMTVSAADDNAAVAAAEADHAAAEAQKEEEEKERHKAELAAKKKRQEEAKAAKKAKAEADEAARAAKAEEEAAAAVPASGGCCVIA